MSAAESAPNVAAKKPRFTVMRGVILLLLVLLAFEGTSYIRLLYVHSMLKAELSKTEKTDYKLHHAQVQKILGGRKPDNTVTKKAAGVGEERYEIFYFDGLLKRRELCVHYGVQGLQAAEPEVVEVLTIIPDEILAISENPPLPNPQPTRSPDAPKEDDEKVSADVPDQTPAKPEEPADPAEPAKPADPTPNEDAPSDASQAADQPKE